MSLWIASWINDLAFMPFSRNILLVFQDREPLQRLKMSEMPNDWEPPTPLGPSAVLRPKVLRPLVPPDRTVIFSWIRKLEFLRKSVQNFSAKCFKILLNVMWKSTYYKTRSRHFLEKSTFFPSNESFYFTVCKEIWEFSPHNFFAKIPSK